MNPRTSFHYSMTAVALAFVVASCAGGSTSGTAAPASAAPAASADSATGVNPATSQAPGADPAATPAPEAPAATLAPDPVNQLLAQNCLPGAGSADGGSAQGEGDGSDGAEFGLTEAEITVRVDAVEQCIATCMSDAGFEYVAVDYATVRQAMDTDSKPSGMKADEFRSQFGYGITTLSLTANAQATLGLGRNVSTRDGLPPSDRAAWVRQLLGESADQTFVVGLDSEDLSRTGGCTRASVTLNFSAGELGPGFVNYQNSDGARIDQDVRVIDAYKAWSTCMRDAGYGYDTSASIDVDLISRLATVTQGADIDTLTGDAAAALTQLQGEELAIAASDHTCDLAHVADIKTKVEVEILGGGA
ncbi:hypothetical protein [Ilumatobacter sp.]|uniref:hypothetical protein n=1 Tax=Ilumatobacter sp. TaxID=1967498 RepID=UPI003752A024